MEASSFWFFLTILLVVLGVILGVYHWIADCYPLHIAVGYLEQAEVAAYADDMISLVKKAYEITSKYHGNPCWWFPTPKTNFDLINKNLKNIIDRLYLIKKLPKTSDAYQQALDDIRGKLRTIRECIASSIHWVYWNWTTVLSIIICFFLWLGVTIIVILRS